MSRGKRLLALLALGALVTGCGYEGAKSLPLPGAIGGKNTYEITVVLDDATNLVAKETCRSNDTVIGSVASVELTDDLRARIVCRIKDSVTLPANAVATLRETSLLGERFVGLDPPEGVAPQGVLARGATMPTATTRTDPDVEMVFGALSQVLNGGSLGSLETITRELQTALSSSDLGGSLSSLDRVVATFNDHRTEIADSLVQLDRLATRLARQKQVLASALDSIPGGLAVLERQRTRLVGTLTRLSSLSRTAVPLIEATRANTAADLRHLAPVLSELSTAGHDLTMALRRIATFPFPDTALSTIKGDFAGMYGTIDLDIDFLNRLLGGPGKYPVSEPPEKTTSTPPATPSNPLDPVLQPVQQSLEGLLNGLLGGGR